MAKKIDLFGGGGRTVGEIIHFAVACMDSNPVHCFLVFPPPERHCHHDSGCVTFIYFHSNHGNEACSQGQRNGTCVSPRSQRR
jgi:hypothetical protein